MAATSKAFYWGPVFPARTRATLLIPTSAALDFNKAFGRLRPGSTLIPTVAQEVLIQRARSPLASRLSAENTRPGSPPVAPSLRPRIRYLELQRPKRDVTSILYDEHQLLDLDAAQGPGPAWRSVGIYAMTR